MENITIEDEMKVTNYCPSMDSIAIEVGDFYISVYLDWQTRDVHTHVDIHNSKTNDTKYLILGREGHSSWKVGI
tara:strand:- start:222 stop:443 length:222 start_codon:yes stop_codon:yes gene_type:complete